ncbi:MAG TPA: hypothetical protein VEG60_06030 [Candidatus Binatia bacterium]|nr:hypothetical protein [Candidatus Binatia bacterium]
MKIPAPAGKSIDRQLTLRPNPQADQLTLRFPRATAQAGPLRTMAPFRESHI